MQRVWGGVRVLATNSSSNVMVGIAISESLATTHATKGACNKTAIGPPHAECVAGKSSLNWTYRLNQDNAKKTLEKLLMLHSYFNKQRQ